LSSVSITKKLLLIVVVAQLSGEPCYIDGLPNISTRPQCSSSGWVVSADFLGWYASQEVASIYADVVTHFGVIPASWGAPSFNFNWDYGFRIGAGYDLEYDQWDTSLSWSWFRTDAKHTIPMNPNASIGPEFFAALLSFSLEGDTVLDVAQSMSARWSLLFNMFDWELGRSFWVSKGLSLRPFLGLKGGWIHQSIDAKYYNLAIDNISTPNLGSEHLKNNFWGVGPLGGVNTKWRARDFGSHFFDLFGDFSVAEMWGSWSCSDVYKSTIPSTSSVNTKNSSLGALTLRGFMGIGWDVDFRENKSHFAAKLGYEMQIWFDQLRIATFQLQRLHNDLTLQGVTFNCRLDY